MPKNIPAALSLLTRKVKDAVAPRRAEQPKATERAGLPPAVDAWMRCEQELLSRAVDTRIIVSPEQNAQDAKYAPEGGKTFKVKSYWLGEDKVRGILGDGLSKGTRDALVRQTKDGPQYRLVVHPESEDFYRSLVKGAERAKDLDATSTASSRTLLVWDPKHPDRPFFAKVSLDKKIGGVVRTVPQGEVARSVGINNVLDGTDLPKGFDYLHEVLGVMPKGFERGGMIIRELPQDVLDGQRKILPLFSLYAKSPDGKPPMLARMIQKTDMPALPFIRQKIISPFLRQWFALAVKQGITEEPHAQNVLMQVGKDGLPNGGFMHRDLGGFNVDFAYRDQLDRKTPTNLPTMTTMDADYHSSKHKETFGFLRTYFVGGFVHNLEQSIPEWMEQGLIDGPKPKDGAFRGMILEELQGLFLELTGEKIDLRDSYDSVPRLITQARAWYLDHQQKTGVVPKMIAAADHVED